MTLSNGRLRSEFYGTAPDDLDQAAHDAPRSSITTRARISLVPCPAPSGHAGGCRAARRRLAHELRRLQALDDARRLFRREQRSHRPAIADGDRRPRQHRGAEMLLGALIPELGIGFLVGRSGGYESFLAASWGCCIATGQAWLDRCDFAVRRPLKTLYVAAEGAAGAAGRIRAWEAANGVSRRGRLLLYPRPIHLNDEGQAEELAEYVAANGIEFVIIDTYHRSTPGAEDNSATEFGVVFEAVARLRDDHGCGVLFIDHTGHLAVGRSRGTSAKGDDADYVLAANYDGESRGPDVQRTLSVTKLKDAESDASWPIGLAPVRGQEFPVVVVSDLADGIRSRRWARGRPMRTRSTCPSMSSRRSPPRQRRSAAGARLPLCGRGGCCATSTTARATASPPRRSRGCWPMFRRPRTWVGGDPQGRHRARQGRSGGPHREPGEPRMIMALTCEVPNAQGSDLRGPNAAAFSRSGPKLGPKIRSHRSQLGPSGCTPSGLRGPRGPSRVSPIPTPRPRSGPSGWGQGLPPLGPRYRPPLRDLARTIPQRGDAMIDNTHAQLLADHAIRRRPWLRGIGGPENPPMGEGYGDERFAVTLDDRIAAITAHDRRMDELVAAFRARRASDHTRKGANGAPRANRTSGRAIPAAVPEWRNDAREGQVA